MGNGKVSCERDSPGQCASLLLTSTPGDQEEANTCVYLSLT